MLIQSFLIFISLFNFLLGFKDSEEKVSVILQQTDGKILIGGTFKNYRNSSEKYFLRLNQDGSLDNNFKVALNTNGFVNTGIIQNDGKILIGGNFTAVNHSNSGHIARLNTDGSKDVGFITGTGFNSWVHAISLQADGKILVGGDFYRYNGTNSNYLIRLNADGSIDSGFNIGSGANSSIYKIKVQNDGKILIAGSFTSFNGTSRQNIARLNADGSIDTGFSTNTSNAITDIAIQNDGKILIGGFFRAVDNVDFCFDVGGGKYCNYLVRLNADGSTDTAFNMDFKADYYVKAIQIQSDGKILIGGFFKKFHNLSRQSDYRGLARLKTDGSFDETFSIGEGADDYVHSLAIQTDGKIIVGGGFENFDKNQKKHLVRIFPTGVLDVAF